MTDKLVRWLRGELPMGDDCIAPDRVCVAGDCECDSANVLAAADRIEVLEQALHEIASNNFLHLTWHSTAPMPIERYKENCEAMVKIARAALGEKKDD